MLSHNGLVFRLRVVFAHIPALPQAEDTVARTGSLIRPAREPILKVHPLLLIPRLLALYLSAPLEYHFPLLLKPRLRADTLSPLSARLLRPSRLPLANPILTAIITVDADLVLPWTSIPISRQLVQLFKHRHSVHLNSRNFDISARRKVAIRSFRARIICRDIQSRSTIPTHRVGPTVKRYSRTHSNLFQSSCALSARKRASARITTKTMSGGAMRS